MTLYLSQLNELWGEPSQNNEVNLSNPIGPICTDSREAVEGCFFVPLIGETYNGHYFIPMVFEGGAQAAVISKSFSGIVPKDCLYWLVDDTLEAYQQLALLHRCDLNIPVIAVTGSTGKTTTRELIKGVLSPLGSVISSAENNNNDVGVPATLFQANKKNAAIIVEMGMRGLGEIQRLSYCSQPDIAVITNIGRAHIGRLGSRENIAIAKCEVTTSLKPNGVVIIPANDSLLEETLSKFWKGKIIRVDLRDDYLPSSNLLFYSNSSRNLASDFLGGVDLQKGILKVDGQEFQLPLDGRHNAMNFMLALAVAQVLGVSFSKIKTFNLEVPWGRNQRFDLAGITFLDETYNASPESVKASLELLVSKPGRHFAVLGAMYELGEHSILLHRQVAQLAVDLGLDGLVIVGDALEAEAMAIAAESLSKLAVVLKPEDAFHALIPWLESGDFVLLKASRAVGLETLIPYLEKHFGKV
tara:strand:+ start:1838 stop:3250 length:1413 start_codon:yes stop_codon:yes gene_type:complete